MCDYGATQCRCINDGPGNTDWTCLTCPTAKPSEGSTCGYGAGFTCPYGNESCTCIAGGHWIDGDKESASWVCGACPATLPTSGATCVAADAACTYGARVCLCRADAPNTTTGAWECGDPCPTTNPPVFGQVCNTPSGLQCVYYDTICTCDKGSFTCN